jgi:hypothetical protein
VAQAATFENILTLEGDDIRNDVVDLPPPVISPGVVNEENPREHQLRMQKLGIIASRAITYR